MRFILLAVFVSVPTGAARAGDDLSDILKSEWGVLSALDNADKAYVVDREVNVNSPETKHKSKNRYEVNMTADCGRLQSAKVVLCWNARYAFNLKKAKGGEPGDWLLGQMITAPPAENALRRTFFTNWFDVSYYKPLTSFYGSTCDSYLTDGSLRVTDHIAQGSLLRVNFELKASFGGDEAAAKESFTGSMVLDPAAHYMVTEAVITRKVLPPRMTEDGRRLKWSRTFEKNRDTLTTSSVAYGTLSGSDATTNTYSDYRFSPTEANEFRVSHYGIPEPPEVKWEKRTPRYLWLLLVAVAFGLLAAALAYGRRRGLSASTQPPPPGAS